MAQVDISAIKSSIKAILDSANTTTALPVDLSNGIANSVRVQHVAKVNPIKIKQQASLFPLVTVYADSKTIENAGIAKNQATSRRTSRFTLNIMAAVWNDNFVDITEDPSDEDVEILMENVEEILRSNTDLSATAGWSLPKDISYHTQPLDEETHLRYALMKYEVITYY